MKVVYADALFVIMDYFLAIKMREVVYEWFIPMALAGLCIGAHLIMWPFVTGEVLERFTSALINLFAILVGFTITTVAVFTTTNKANNPFLSELSTRDIGGTKITWYQFIYVNLIYGIIAGIAVLCCTLVALLIDKQSGVPNVRLTAFAVLVFGTAHVLLLTIRNVTNLYYAFFELPQP